MVLTVMNGVEVDGSVRRSIVGNGEWSRGDPVTRNCRRKTCVVYS